MSQSLSAAPRGQLLRNHNVRRFAPSRRALHVVATGLALAIASGGGTAAEPAASKLDAIQVSATRFADAVQEVPNSIAVITDQELAARGVQDLRGALRQLAGITVGPGGDDGSAGSSLGLLGRRETDDFLLVIDGVPAGGAFTPQFATLNLHNVERIEVIRGTAPVYYGTTAFAGTISILHYAAGKGPTAASLSLGSFGSVDLGVGGVVSDGPIRQTLSLDATRNGSSDARADFRRIHGLYRAATELAGGEARVDLDVTDLRDKPASPTPYDGGNALLPADFNQNPTDARIDTRIAKLTAAYDHKLGDALWSTLVSLTHTHTDTVRGFLDSGYAAATDTNATGYTQGRGIDDLFFDTHINQALAKSVDITYGLNVLDGELGLHSRQFAYLVPFDGSAAAASGNWDTIDNTQLSDHRTFYGAYAQTRWRVTDDVSVLTGLRLNHTREVRDGYGDLEGADHQELSSSRLSGSLGVNWWVWRDTNGDLDDLSLYANFGNTFQPPQVDFGPDAQIGPILKSESLQSAEFGIKADGLDGRLDLSLSTFFVRFGNRPLNTTVNGEPAVVAGGEERFRGFEFEANFKLTDSLKLQAEYSRNVGTYGNFLTQPDGGGDAVQLSGKRLDFVPDQVLGLGLTLAPATGWQAALSTQYIGSRFLDPENDTAAGGFTTFNALAGYRWKNWALRISAENLSDRRDPVVASELGAGQAYRLAGRRVFASVSTSLD